MPGECSAVCGPGEAKLNVSCVRPEGGQEVEVDQRFCSKLIKPSESVPCVVDVCPVGWESQGEDEPMLKSGLLPRSSQTRVYVWSPVISQCSKTCGNGTLQVWFSCVDHQTRKGVLHLHCDGSSKPSPYSEPCNMFPCPPMWSTPAPSTGQPPLVFETTRWRAKQGVCSVTCGGGLVNRVIYCSRETDSGGEVKEEVLDDAECSGFFKPPAVVSCNTHNCPARWRVLRTSPCSVSCDLGVAQRTVSCVQFLHGDERLVPEENCHAAVKPATRVPCLVQACTFRWEVRPWSQCSVSCGYGIQSRAVSCMGPSNQEPISPLLCMHIPKPITIQGCHMDSCGSATLTSEVTTAVKTEAGVSKIDKPPSLSPTESIRLSTTTVPTPKQSACGQLLLEESGTVDLRNMSHCIVSIGRPLDEVIHVKVESGSLNCRRREFVLFYDRLVLVRKCEQVAGSELTTRANVLLVRQYALSPENGVLFTYTSQKSQKKSHHQECDVQLFPPNGVFENPTTSSTNHTCRVLINAPPAMKIKIQSLRTGIVFNSTNSQSTYIMIRDMHRLKTSVFKGQQQFLWQSSGNMAEVEFHGDYLHNKGSFRAEYSFLHP